MTNTPVVMDHAIFSKKNESKALEMQVRKWLQAQGKREPEQVPFGYSELASKRHEYNRTAQTTMREIMFNAVSESKATKQKPRVIDKPAGQRHSALEVALTGKNLFILGKPGAGKTTFLKYLAILCCKSKIRKTPIFVSLKDWSDSSLSIIPYIAKQFDICGLPNAQPFVEALLERGDALVLLDGLDEVNEAGSKRSQTIREIVNLSKKYKKCQYCTTCRTAATDYSFEQFTYLEVADFDSAQQPFFP